MSSRSFARARAVLLPSSAPAAVARPVVVEQPAPRPAPVPSAPARDPDRFELKYWVPEELTGRILEYARPYLVLDPFSVRLGVLSQYNTSLYLESPQLSSYRHHTDSSADRWKLRVRVYGDQPTGLAFFEVKRKMKSVIVKTRAGVPLDRVTPLLEGCYDALPERLSPEERRNLESFLYLQTVTHARPCVLVRAHRESYCTPDPQEDVRMTFDRQICFQRPRGASVGFDPRGWIPIDGEEQHRKTGRHTLLELKFPRVAPFWMRRLVSSLDMWRVGYSKYIAAVQTLLDEPLRDDLERDAERW